MAVTLGTELATAQDSLERRPIVEIIATQQDAAIPFDGTYFNLETDTESVPDMMRLSDNRIAVIYLRSNYIYYLYTDVDQTYWTTVTILTAPASNEIGDISFLELSDGNIGLVYVLDYSFVNDIVYYAIITSSGTISVASTVLYNPSSSSIRVTGLNLVTLQDGTYYLVYVEYNGTDTYAIKYRTSSDFQTWSSASTISLSGLTASHPINNLSIKMVSSGELVMVFQYATSVSADGTTLYNIYLTQSTDDGATWSAPEVQTSYSVFGTQALHPDLAVTSTDGLYLTYCEERNVLFADDSTSLWQTDNKSDGTYLQFDSSTKKLYVYQIYTNTGNKVMEGIVVMDTETWTVSRVYNTTSSPAYNSMFANEHVWYKSCHSEGHIVAFATCNTASQQGICVINNNSVSITQYFLKNSTTYGVNKNVDIEWEYEGQGLYGTIQYTWYDENSQRLYVLYTYPYFYFPTVRLFYIDTTESPSGSGYQVSDVFYSSNGLPTSDTLTDFRKQTDVQGLSEVYYIAEYNWWVLACRQSVSTWKGGIWILDGNGNALKRYDYDLNPTFPYQGCDYIEYYDGCIYGSITYNSVQSSTHGMVKINLLTNQISFHRPTWVTADDYDLRGKKSTGDGRLIIAAYGYGAAVYDIDSDTWTLYNDDTIPGFEPTSNPITAHSVEYDSTNEVVFLGSIYTIGVDGFDGIRAFSINGAFSQGQYALGTESGGSWSFSAFDQLTQFNYETELVCAVNEEDTLFSAWVHRNDTEYSIQWDQDVASMELTDYLVAGSAVSVDYSVESSNQLSFRISDGHLFDPNNLLSIYHTFLEKGKLITLRFGENISGTEYWSTQGSFIVTAIKLTYARGTYPSMQVTCEDVTAIWEDIHVDATEYYSEAYPEDILQDIIEDFTVYTSSNIDIDEFDNRHTIYHQWLDDDLMSIIRDLLDHFNYIPYIATNGDFVVKKVTVSGSVDHIYSGSELIEYTPDDNYSSYTTKVIVYGEEEGTIEIVYPEELVGNLTGTVGWWSDKTYVKRVYYSEDQERRCRNPRLDINDSVKDWFLLFKSSDVDEYISDIDIEEKYIDVTIESPGHMTALAGIIAGFVTLGYNAATCDTHASCGKHMIAFSLAVTALSYMLAEIGTYDYNIYAQPIGEEKQKISAYAEDTEFKQKLNGQEVTESIDDSYCNTVEQCQDVADQEMDIVKAQRRRVKFKKIAHLQDEICDRIQLNHPFSSDTIDVFITNLQREYIKPERGASDSGSFIDTITGWIV